MGERARPSCHMKAHGLNVFVQGTVESIVQVIVDAQDRDQATFALLDVKGQLVHLDTDEPWEVSARA